MWKILAFISSYFPLFLFISVRGWIVKDGASGALQTIEQWAGISLSIIGVAYLLVIYFMPSSPKDAAEGERVAKVSNDSLINYLMAYVIPSFLSSEDMTLATFLINILVIIMIAILYVRLDLVFLNPLLAIFGFLPRAETTTGKIYLTNLTPMELQARIDSKRRVYGSTIADNVIFAKKKDNEF
ncbi:hypothetical protein [Lacticaseibacillus paracasei]|uniref:hypothetical protein n=1 Tax=Lacticaseibacillus paracasei TaxID=1597 RepID=UPI000E09DE80|nr:hypothetical protein [Lacticaseibacillus paracasei]MDM7530952.1 hypothetical protein [Lacticaseibacillus paracasei]RDF91111.1 hypothetical protein DQM23_08300 [Lacticaseibacillus paracasei]